MACHIKLNNLALTYRWKAYQKNIFSDLNLCIPMGAFVTIVGGNGSGKSSLVKLILGLVAPDAGQVLINDIAVKPGDPEAVRNKQIAYLSQQIEDFFFSETVAEELNYHGDLSQESDSLSILQSLGLDTLMDRKVDDLSGGERQSLALAQFMVGNAPLLILDEPSSYLDETKASILKAYLQKAHSSEKTILHITQFDSEFRWGTHVIDLNSAEPSVSIL